MILQYENPFYLRTQLINTGTGGVRVLLIHKYYPAKLLIVTSTTVFIVESVPGIDLWKVLLPWNLTV